MKNDCQVDHIKEAFDKLYNSVMPYIDLAQFDDADKAFKELDQKVHSEIYILKKCLAESDRAVDAGLTRSEVDRKRISDLESENNAKQHAIESFVAKVNDLEKKIRHLEIENANLRVTPADALEALKKENSELKVRNFCLAATCNTRSKSLSEATKELEQYKKNNIRQRGVIDNLEKEINTLKKKIHDLEEENDSLTEDADALVEENADIHTRPWHGDGNAMTGARNYCESLSEIIEFQSKKIKELKAENEALKKEASKLRTRSEDDLSYGHEFEFGDEVFVPWSCDPYMYIKSGQLYNPRTERLVYVGKDQHLKWFGEKFAIV